MRTKYSVSQTLSCALEAASTKCLSLQMRTLLDSDV